MTDLGEKGEWEDEEKEEFHEPHRLDTQRVVPRGWRDRRNNQTPEGTTQYR